MDDRLTSQFVRGVFSLGTATIGQLVLGLVIAVFAVRFVPKEEYGVYVLFLTVIYLAVMISDLGLGISTTKHITSTDGEERERLVNSVLLLRLIVLVASGSLCLIAGELILLLFGSTMLASLLIFLPVILLLQSFSELLSSMLQGFQLYSRLAMIEITGAILHFGAIYLTLVVLRMGIKGLIYSTMVCFLYLSIAKYFVVPVRRKLLLDLKILYKLIRFGFPLYLNSILNILFIRADVLIIGALLPATSVAYYEVAGKIPTVCNRLYDSFRRVFFPNMSEMFHNNSKIEAESVLNNSVRLICFISLLGTLIVTIFQREIIETLFSREYSPSIGALSLLLVNFGIGAISNTLGTTLVAAGYPSYPVKVNIVMSVLSLSGNLLLIPIYGYIGAVYAILIANYITNPILVYYLGKVGIRVSVYNYVVPNLAFWACYGFIESLSKGLILKFVVVALFCVFCTSLSFVRKTDFVRLFGSFKMRSQPSLE